MLYFIQIQQYMAFCHIKIIRLQIKLCRMIERAATNSQNDFAQS